MPLAMRIFWYVMPFAPLALALPVMQSEVHAGLVDETALLPGPLPVVRHIFCTAFPWTTTRASPLLVPCTTWTASAPAAPFTGMVNSGMPRELELQVQLQVQLEDLNDRVLGKLIITPSQAAQ